MIVHHDWNAAMPCKHSCSACFSVMLLACEDDQVSKSCGPDEKQFSHRPACRRNPFRKGDGWLVWALLGIVTAPAVIALVATALSAISYEVLS